VCRNVSHNIISMLGIVTVQEGQDAGFFE
jgi:hypothetical protein